LPFDGVGGAALALADEGEEGEEEEEGEEGDNFFPSSTLT
jgi:hypothetical protein